MRKKRIDHPTAIPSQTNALLTKAADDLRAMKTGIETFGVHLTEDERKRVVKPPNAFFSELPGFLRACEAHPQLGAGANVDPKHLRDMLEADKLLEPVLQESDNIHTLTQDTHLAWVDYIADKVLELYGIAKQVAKRDASVQEVVKLGAQIYPGHPGKPAAPPPPPGEPKPLPAGDPKKP